MPFQVLDLRSSPVSLAASLPSASLVASPDCSVICDDKDFFKLVSGGGRWDKYEGYLSFFTQYPPRRPAT